MANKNANVKIEVPSPNLVWGVTEENDNTFNGESRGKCD